MTALQIAEAYAGRPLYRVVTARGVPLGAVPATEDQKKAMAHAKAAAPHYPGCYVEEIEVSVRRRKVYAPRPAKADPFAIPAMGVVS